MQLVDARQIAIKLKEQAYNYPPRSSTDIVKSVKRDNSYSGVGKLDCSSSLYGISTRQEVDDYLEKLGSYRAHYAYYQAEQHIKKGNIRRAIELIKISLRNTEYYDEKVKRYAKLAMYNIRILELDEARYASSSANVWFREMSDRDYYKDEARLWVRLARGLVAESRGDFAEAEENFRNALDVAGKGKVARGGSTSDQNSRGRYASSYLHLANNLLLQGRLHEAENQIRELLGLSSQSVPEARARALELFGRILLEQGRYYDAEKIITLAMDDFRIGCVAQNNIALISAKETFGKVLILQGKSAEANAYFEDIAKAIDSEKSTFELLLDENIFRVIALLQVEHWRDARSVLQRNIDSLEASSKEDNYKVAERKGLLAISFFETGEKEKARKFFSDSIPILYANAGSTEFNNFERYTSDYIRKYIFESYLRRTIGRDSGGVNFSTNNSAINEGFKLVSVLHGSSVAQELALSTARTVIDDPELKAIIRESQDISKQISALKNNLRQILALPEDQIDVGIVPKINDRIVRFYNAQVVLVQEIEQRFPKYADLTQPKPLTISEVQDIIQPIDSLLAIYSAKDSTYIWAIPKSGDVSFASVDLGRDELANIVDKLRLALNPEGVTTLSDIPDFDLALSHDLYKKLLEPVKAGWKDAKNLLVTTHGPLGQLPFSLLVTRSIKLASRKNLNFANYRDVPWLIRTHAVTVLPSVTSLYMLRSASVTIADRRPFIGFGDPYFNIQQASEADKESPFLLASNASPGVPSVLRSVPNTRAMDSATLDLLPRLPDTRLEIQAIATTLGADMTNDIFLGINASEHNAKTKNLSGYKIISFATHGLLPGDLNGLTEPALALSSPLITGDKGDDGLLTASEILNLKLNADWVVLSACNTAAGNGQGAETVFGLSQSFFYAGSRALLVSNWPVHSAATTQLMTTLFSLQAQDNTLDRARALQQTELYMIDEAVETGSDGNPIFSYAHPIFWAPFTIVGDPR